MPAGHSLRSLGRSRQVRQLQCAAPVAASVLLVLGVPNLASVVGAPGAGLYSPAQRLSVPRSKAGGAAVRGARAGGACRPPAQIVHGKGADEAVQCSGRRAATGTGFLAALGSLVPPAAATGPQITARCAFDIRIGHERVNHLRQVVIGLYGHEAPVMTRTFVEACSSTYPGEAGVQASYKLADVKTVVKDKYISWADFKDGNQFAEVRTTNDKRWVGTETIMKPLAGDDTKTEEVNGLRHDLAGRVSMRRGGGTFDFNVAPVADAEWLDETDVVIGQVLEGMEVIEDINNIQVYGSRPLKKIRIYRSELLA